MNRLYRSRSDAVIAGVCGGLGHYMGIDPILIRVLFVLLAIFGDGAGVLIYIIMAIVVPRIPEGQEEVSSARPFFDNRQAGLLIGGGLIVWGGLLLLDALNVTWLWWLDSGIIWPLVLIVGGGLLLWRAFRQT